VRLSAEYAEPHLLLLAYYFPPIGGAGVQRSLKFARYLPDAGCRVSVVTGTGATTGRWTPLDPSLSDELPAGTQVLRAAGAEPTGRASLGRACRWLRLSTAWDRWWEDAAVEAGAAARDVDVIVASASPYSTLEAGARLARIHDIPWIADLRDPWALDEMEVYPTDLHRRLELERMGRVLSTASGIVMNTPEAGRMLLATFPELHDRRIEIIPNGFDRADFDNVTPARADSDTFRIVHTGYLHMKTGLQQRERGALRRMLGGHMRGVDILTRSHYFLLEAIERLLREDPSLRRRLEIHLAGALTDVGERLAAQSAITTTYGYLPHAESVRLICSADLLFLPLQNLGPGRRSTTVPGKTYEYLASGHPILGAVPPGDARDLLVELGHYVCEPDGVDCIARSIRQAIDARDAGRRREPTPSQAAIVESFERRSLASTLADLARDVVSERVGLAARRAA